MKTKVKVYSELPDYIKQIIFSDYENYILKFVKIALIISCGSIMASTIFSPDGFRLVISLLNSLFVFALIIGLLKITSFKKMLLETDNIRSSFLEDGIILEFADAESTKLTAKGYRYRDIKELDIYGEMLIVKLKKKIFTPYEYSVLDLDGFIKGNPQELVDMFYDKTNLYFYPELGLACKKRY